MDKLRAMHVFTRIVDAGSLTAAAAGVAMSLPSVVRLLAALEAALDVRLLNRTTRRISLTDEGREYYARCKRVLAEIDEAEAALSARRASPKGRLRITAPVMFGRLHVVPVAADFGMKHPAVTLDFLLLDRSVDLVEEGVDVGVRIGHLPDSSLVAVPVGETGRVVCASPGYVRRAGRPKSAAELARHRCIDFSGLAPLRDWQLGSGANATRVVVDAVLVSNQVDAAVDACVRGLGVGQFLRYQVQSSLDSGRLQCVMRDLEPPPLPIHVIYPHSRLLSANVRAFVDWMVPRLRVRLRAREA